MTTSTKHPRRLLDAYRFPGFRPQATVKGVFGDPKARIVTLVRRGKKQSADVVVRHSQVGMTASSGVSAICPVATPGSGWRSKCVGFTAGPAAR